jgi:CRP-like cAMP-binding protein
MRADHDVVRERDRPSQCCLVLEGWLYRYKMLEDGKRQIFSFHIAGDMPDLQSLHLKTMDHSLAAPVQSRVAFVQHDTIRELVKTFPRLGALLWRDTLIDAAIFRQWMIGMGRKDAPQKIAHLFCELFTKMDAVGLTNRNSCKFPVTQSALGDALGLSTVHVNRSLMELRGNGFITLEKQTLTILKWNELQRYAQFDPLYLHMETTAEAA